MNFHLKIWRQKNASSAGRMVACEAKNIPEDASFLEMLDIVIEDLIGRGEEPVAFDCYCRGGTCGSCSLTLNGIAHGPSPPTVCQFYLRKLLDGATFFIEPFRARSFSVVRDLCS